jgi:hypothetical protein
MLDRPDADSATLVDWLLYLGIVSFPFLLIVGMLLVALIAAIRMTGDASEIPRQHRRGAQRMPLLIYFFYCAVWWMAGMTGALIAALILVAALAYGVILLAA